MDDDRFLAEFAVDVDEVESYVRGEIDGPDQLLAKWVGGTKPPTDIVLTTCLSGLIVSDVFLESIRDLTGWNFIPVILEDEHGRSLSNYNLLIFEGRCGPIDPSRSQIIGARQPDRPVVKGMYFAEDDWDQTDFFMLIERTLFLFVSKRAMAIMSKFANGQIEFTKMSEIEQDPLAMQTIVDHQENQGISKFKWRWGDELNAN